MKREREKTPMEKLEELLQKMVCLKITMAESERMTKTMRITFLELETEAIKLADKEIQENKNFELMGRFATFRVKEYEL